MKFCKLEIVLHSGKSLNDVKIFGTMDPYVVVWISGGGKETKALKTEVAKRGGSFPVWNYSMDFNISSMNNSYTLFCEIVHDGHIVDRNIGQVQIPFKDLLAGDASGKNVSYPVKIWSGEVKGEIILSHKFSQPKVKEKDSSGKVTDRPKVKEKDSSGKVTDRPKKKGDQKKKKKKNGMMKPIGKRVVTQVASEAILLAGTAGLIVALDDGSSMSAAVDVEFNDEDQDQDQDEDQDQDQDEDEDEDDQDEDEDEDDQDEDEDEDQDQDEEDEDEDEDQDEEDEDEYEDEDDDDDDYDDDD